MRWVGSVGMVLGLLALPLAGDSPSLVGKAAPALELKDLKGQEHRLADLKGRLVVLQFMTSWCPFSKAMGPHVEALREAYGKKGVEVLVVAVGESRAKARLLAQRHKLHCPVLPDPEGRVAAGFAPPEAQPDLPRDQVVISSNLIVGKDGNIVYQALLDTDHFDPKLGALRARLDELLAVP